MIDFDSIFADFDAMFAKITAFFAEIQTTLMNLFASYDAGENTTYSAGDSSTDTL
ncbi:MAG: hypothetical protein R3Y27_05060 [Clostridia bacterium]